MKPKDTLAEHFRINEKQKKALKRLGVETVEDMLYHFPNRYITIADVKFVQDLVVGDHALLYGKVTRLKTSKGYKSKIPMAEGYFEDDTGSIKVIWFNQAYIAKMLKEDVLIKMEGKVAERTTPGGRPGNGKLYISNPEYEMIPKLPEKVGNSLWGKSFDSLSIPVYSERAGISSKWMYHAVQKILASGILGEMEDRIPEEILKKYSLPNIEQSLVWIHTPKKDAHSVSARKRFAFEEVFLVQLQKQMERKEYEKEPSYIIEPDKEVLDKFIERFPFTPTKSQSMAIKEIVKDISTPSAMSRLLEGDVGSGKTAVAAATTHAVVTTRPLNADGDRQDFGHLQVGYMAPTEILAKQHFESFIEYFRHMPIQIGLITSSGCRKFPSRVNAEGYTDISRAQLLKWVANGQITVLIGTHSLISKTVKFQNLAYVIIDEQHRFGINQRKALVRGKTQTERELTQTTHTETERTEGALLHKDLSYTLRGIVYDVKKNLGLGHKEILYQSAFEEELKAKNIKYSREKRISIMYREKKIGVYIPDFVVEDSVLVEFKALPRITQKEYKQLWTYLKGSDYKLALLINFGAEDVEIKRVVYDTARTGPYQSASSPRESAQQGRPLPHLLSMTATPIPRTLALTIYGDLDLTLLDEMPKGRKTIITEIVPPTKRDGVYEHMRGEMKNGRQAYVICSRIDEPDPAKERALQLKSVKEEARRLKKDVFPDKVIGILHGKMKTKEKDEVMLDFLNHKIDILCATSVVEVGVNVPNSTMIVIEGADRFGLSQLHQLRGRVVRSNHQAYCYIFTDSKSKKTLERLKALGQAKNGFELAEHDLMLRGAGELTGTRQWGISDIAMEALRNLKMVEAARTEAKEIVDTDPELKKHPRLKAVLESQKMVHLE